VSQRSQSAPPSSHDGHADDEHSDGESEHDSFADDERSDSNISSTLPAVYHILDHKEAIENEAGCVKAMEEELRRWHDHGAWIRFPKSQAKNRLDSRWVLKWKNRRNPKTSQWETVITARLTARGFRDVQAVETFSATSSRWGQRLVLATAAQRKWEIVSADISQAFLRGVTFESLAAAG